MLVHASQLARHTQGLGAGAHVGILVHEQDGPEKDPLQIERLMFDCTVQPFERMSPDWEAGRELYLARFPDSRITFKLGVEVAAGIRAEAATLLPLCQPVATAKSVAGLLAFDGDLKARGLNPGTTADLVVATLFTSLIETEIAASAGP